VSKPVAMGSYRTEDVTLLLGEAEGSSPEFVPSPWYMAAVRRLIEDEAHTLAQLVGTLGERLLARRGDGLVLASIARAGTPAGILVRRWLAYRHGLDVPHYSLSVAGGRVDANAIAWLNERHDPSRIHFLDAWTSKGTIQRTLTEAVEAIGAPGLDPSLAVLADPGWCTDRFATRADVLLPLACLGAGVSGLLGATMAAPEEGGGAFHRAPWFRDLAAHDLSNDLIAAAVAAFPSVDVDRRDGPDPLPDHRGMRWARALAERSGADLHLINIGLSESTRAFFRRSPELLLVRAGGDGAELAIRLAQERGVPVREEAALPVRAAVI
jgi:hypothetical protein